nr:MAG TPA: hypothetical protein [Caudoviricetes sp.]
MRPGLIYTHGVFLHTPSKILSTPGVFLSTFLVISHEYIYPHIQQKRVLTTLY